MADHFSHRYGDLLQGSYDCVDRIVLNAHSLGHSAGGFREWWRQLNNGSEDDLDNAHLMRMAGRFVLREHVIAPILAGVRSPRLGRKPATWTPVDRHYEQLRIRMEPLFHELGLAA